MGLFFYTQKGSIISMVDLPTTEIIEPQLVASLALDNHGAKMKYLLFAPGYMVWYCQMNAITIATTFIPAIKTVFGFAGKGTWVSPTRTKMTKKEGES